MSSLQLVMSIFVMSIGYHANCMSATNPGILPKSTDAVLADVCISQHCVVGSVSYMTHPPSGEDSILYAHVQHLRCNRTLFCLHAWLQTACILCLSQRPTQFAAT